MQSVTSAPQITIFPVPTLLGSGTKSDKCVSHIVPLPVVTKRDNGWTPRYTWATMAMKGTGTKEGQDGPALSFDALVCTIADVHERLAVQATRAVTARSNRSDPLGTPHIN